MADGDRFSFALDLTPDDYQHYFSLLGQRQQSETRTTWPYVVAILAVFPVATFLGLYTPATRLAIGMSCGVAFALGLIAMMRVLRLEYAMTMRHLGARGAKEWKRFSVTIDADGVMAAGDDISIRSNWSAIRDVTVEHGGVMIWMGVLQAVHIPARAFASIAERDAVVTYLSARLERA